MSPCGRPLRAGLVLLSLAAALGAAPAAAFDRFEESEAIATPSDASARGWAPRSLVDIALPMALRMRVRGSRAWGLVTPDELDLRSLDGFRSDMRFDRDLISLHGQPLAMESHVQITHGLGGGVELGVAWSSRSQLSRSVDLDLDRHFVGCVLRFTR